MSGFFLDESELLPIKQKAASTKTALVEGCAICPLPIGCKNPRMDPWGYGRLGIMVIGEAPGEEEDKLNKAFVGPTGRMLFDAMKELGVDLYQDCIITNSVQCRPKNNEYPPPEIAKNCLSRMREQIKHHKPKLIFAVGGKAINAVLKPPFAASSTIMSGRSIPMHSYGCWVSCIYHPSYVARSNNDSLRERWVKDIAQGLEYIDKPLPKPIDSKAFRLLVDENEVIRYLNELRDDAKPYAFDYETNCLSPFQSNAKILTVSFAREIESGVCIPIQHPGHVWSSDQLHRIFKAMKELFRSRNRKVIQNAEFEILWTKVVLKTDLSPEIWDTMVTNHAGDERADTNSLEFMAFCNLGLIYKDMVNKAKLESTPLSLVAEYNVLDSRCEFGIYQAQQLTLSKEQINGAKFFSSCVDTLADMKYHGVRIDTNLLEQLDVETSKELAQHLQSLSNQRAVREFERFKNKSFSALSGPDVRALLYEQMKVPIPADASREGKVPKVDTAAFDAILKSTDNPEVKQTIDLIVKVRKHTKQRSTYLEGPKSWIDSNGVIHPTFMLHTVSTYRSSSADPNFQNFPKRDPEAKKMRRIFIPKNDLFIEGDFKGAEVCVMAMLSKDKLLREMLAADVDVHKYWAAQLYGIAESAVTKDHRFVAKNKFVFPEFYGSWYKPIAMGSGLDVDVVKRTEDKFWNQHSGIRAYLDAELKHYETFGFVQLPVGFRRHAPLSRNEIFNTKIQGTAFHLLLAGARVFTYRARERGLKSHLVIEVHDSVLGDVVLEEMEEVVDLMHSSFEQKHFGFQENVKLEFELMYGLNWLDMEALPA